MARSHRLATLGGAIALAIAVLGLLALWAARQREPSYQGRNLSEWLTLCRSTATSQHVREEAASAVRHIGTNGLPILLNRATDAPPQTREKVRDYLDQHSIRFVPRFVRDWAHKPPDHTRAYEARMGLMILGPEAAPAIPFLTTLALGPPSQHTPYWAVGALGDIGVPALPAMLTILTNPAAPTRAQAVTQIARFGTNAAPALPALIQGLDGRCSEVVPTFNHTPATAQELKWD